MAPSNVGTDVASVVVHVGARGTADGARCGRLPRKRRGHVLFGGARGHETSPDETGKRYAGIGINMKLGSAILPITTYGARQRETHSRGPG